MKNPTFSLSHEALTFIYENVLKSGLGAVNKGELEVILFSALMLYSDWKSKTDLELSKELGVTQSKVRSLREKASLRYIKLTLDEALASFAECIMNGETDVTGTYLEVLIPDIAVQKEIEGLLKNKRILYKKQLNTMIIQIRLDKFVGLFEKSPELAEKYNGDQKQFVRDLIAKRKEFKKLADKKLTTPIEKISRLLSLLKEFKASELFDAFSTTTQEVEEYLKEWFGRR